MKWTKELPNKNGYYWFNDFSEDCPVVLRINKDKHGFYATDEEFCFLIGEENNIFWCYIPEPPITTEIKKAEENYFKGLEKE